MTSSLMYGEMYDLRRHVDELIERRIERAKSEIFLEIKRQELERSTRRWETGSMIVMFVAAILIWVVALTTS